MRAIASISVIAGTAVVAGVLVVTGALISKDTEMATNQATPGAPVATALPSVHATTVLAKPTRRSTDRPTPTSNTSSDTTALSTTSSANEAMREWASRAKPHFGEAANAFENGRACIDARCIRDTCRTAHKAVMIDLEADLPSPDPKLTAAMQSMIDDFDKGFHMCMEVSDNPTAGEVEQFESFANEQLAHVETAQAIVEKDVPGMR